MPKLSALFLMRPTEIKLLFEPASHTKNDRFCLSTATNPPSWTVSDAEILLHARLMVSGKHWPLCLAVREATSSDIRLLSDPSRFTTPHFRTPLSIISSVSPQLTPLQVTVLLVHLISQPRSPHKMFFWEEDHTWKLYCLAFKTKQNKTQCVPEYFVCKS